MYVQQLARDNNIVHVFTCTLIQKDQVDVEQLMPTVWWRHCQLLLPRSSLQTRSTKSTVDLIMSVEVMQISAADNLPLYFLCNHIRATDMLAHQQPHQNELERYDARQGHADWWKWFVSCPLAMQSDCEIYFLHYLPPEFKARMSLHSSRPYFFSKPPQRSIQQYIISAHLMLEDLMCNFFNCS